MSTNHERIEALISKTSDPVQQATLLVLSKIANDLDENTRATERIANSTERHQAQFQAHVKNFDKHVVDEQRMVAGAKGAWWASTLMIGAVMLLGGVIVKGYNDNVVATMTVVQDLVTRMSVVEATVRREHSNGYAPR